MHILYIPILTYYYFVCLSSQHQLDAAEKVRPCVWSWIGLGVWYYCTVHTLISSQLGYNLDTTWIFVFLVAPTENYHNSYIGFLMRGLKLLGHIFSNGENWLKLNSKFVLYSNQKVLWKNKLFKEYFIQKRKGSHFIKESMHNYKTLSVSRFLCSKRPLEAWRIFLIQSETLEGPNQEMKEPEEKYEENNSPLLS